MLWAEIAGIDLLITTASEKIRTKPNIGAHKSQALGHMSIHLSNLRF